jgi:hypothetical protein
MVIVRLGELRGVLRLEQPRPGGFGVPYQICVKAHLSIVIGH